jgi:hypothetical protein
MGFFGWGAPTKKTPHTPISPAPGNFWSEPKLFSHKNEVLWELVRITPYVNVRDPKS